MAGNGEWDRNIMIFAAYACLWTANDTFATVCLVALPLGNKS